MNNESINDMKEIAKEIIDLIINKKINRNKRTT